MNLLLDGSATPIDLIIFDCDGVLLDTMPAKIEAFRSWVPAEWDRFREPFMEIVMAGFGTARTHHIRRFYEELVAQPVSEAFLSEEVARFSEICEPLCASAAWRAGSKEFVLACREAGVPRLVLSGTPQAPLEGMLQSTGAAEFFDQIVGSPPMKPESLLRMIRERDVPPYRSVFIGDAEADRAAAHQVGAHFVYFPSEADPPKGPLKTTVSNLLELLPGAKAAPKAD
jgi:beta-phosphoglucomutase-like phosphatase (HAD superfamily)